MFCHMHTYMYIFICKGCIKNNLKKLGGGFLTPNKDRNSYKHVFFFRVIKFTGIALELIPMRYYEMYDMLGLYDVC